MLWLCSAFTLLVTAAATGIANVDGDGRRQIVVRTEAEVQKAFSALEDSQTVIFNTSEVALSKTLFVHASDVIVRGAPGGTTLMCPPSGIGVLEIRGRNVRLANLEFCNCVCATEDSSALRLLYKSHARPAMSLSTFADLPSFGRLVDNEEYDVTLHNCSFLNNGKLGHPGIATCRGSAIYARESRLLIDSCSFTKNEALSGGAIFMERCIAKMQHINSSDNSAGRFSGFAHTIRSIVTILDSNFRNNRAGSGGVFFFEFSQVYVEDSIFKSNNAERGGAVAMAVCNVTLLRCTFDGNSVDEIGGACGGSLGNLTIEHSTFKMNDAKRSGGAIDMQRGNLAVRDSVFNNNSAGLTGGAIRVQRTKVTIGDSDFVANNASRSGGAIAVFGGGRLSLLGGRFEQNLAKAGGGVAVLDSSFGTLTSGRKRPLSIVNNTATYGGAVACVLCEKLLIGDFVFFLENVAYESGGGLFFSGTGFLHITSPTPAFRRNIAAVGGGAALVDCMDISIGVFSVPDFVKLNFEDNMALTGGGLYIRASEAPTQVFDVNHIKITGNVAFTEDDIGMLRDDHVVQRWISGRGGLTRETRSSDTTRWMNGRGGGFYFDFTRGQLSISLAFIMHGTHVTGNRAHVGGGGYIKTDPAKWIPLAWERCKPTLPGDPSCWYFTFVRTRIDGNVALTEAGGLFITSSGMLLFLCSYKLPEAERTTILRKQKCVTVENNMIQDGPRDDPGHEVNSDGQELELLNFDRPIECLTAGERLGVPKSGRCPSEKVRSIKVAVKNIHGRVIDKNTEGSDLTIVLVSEHIFGQKQYKAVKGIITINNTNAVGINVTGELIIRAAKDKALNVTLSFRTRPCFAGEVETESRCVRCKPESYSLNVSQECRKCEEHARCLGGAALLPEDGYWHSTPYSPFFHRCLVEEACRYKERRDKLFEYYTNSSRQNTVVEKPESMNEADGAQQEITYEQCSEEYDGILCGSCRAGYGHSPSGKCVECSSSRAIARLITAAAGFVMFAIMTVKLGLTFMAARNDASAAESDEAETVLEQAGQAEIAEAPAGDGRQSTSENVEEAASALQGNAEDVYLPRCTFPREGGPDSNAGPSQRSANSILDRAPLVLRRAADPRRTAIAATRTKTGEHFVDTFNILFNYAQLNSVALSLDVEWGGGMSPFLAIQNVAGRITSLFSVLPFECNFEPEDASGDSNVAVYSPLYRAGLPVLMILLYLVIIKLWRYIHIRRWRGTVAIIPSLRLVTLLVLFTSMIDIVGELLKVPACIKLSKDVGHPYVEFDTLGTGYIWADDTSVTCYHGQHLAFSIVAVLGVTGCIVALIWIVVILVLGSRRDYLNKKSFILRYGFLYSAYRRKGLALYWECWITLRRMLLAFVAVYTRYMTISTVQLGLLGMIVLVSLAAHSVVQPFHHTDFRDTFPSYACSGLNLVGAPEMAQLWISFNQEMSLNFLEGSALFMSATIAYTGIAIADQRTSETFRSTLLTTCCCLNYAFTAFMIYRLWYILHKFLDAKEAERRLAVSEIEESDDGLDKWLGSKAWTLLKATVADYGGRVGIAVGERSAAVGDTGLSAGAPTAQGDVDLIGDATSVPIEPSNTEETAPVHVDANPVTQTFEFPAVNEV